MPSRIDRAVDVVRKLPVLAVVPVLGTLLSISKLIRTLQTGSGGGISFPFPTGVPTLWTYVSVAGGPGPIGAGGALVGVNGVLVFLLGLVVMAVLESGLLGSIDAILDERDAGFWANVDRYLLRVLGVNLIQAAITFAMLPVFIVSPGFGLVVLLAVMYIIYGFVFEVIARDCSLMTGLSMTVDDAVDGGIYAGFGVAHLVLGAALSVVLTPVVRTTGVLGVVTIGAIIAVPAVVVAGYGMIVFRELAEDVAEV